jgi:hypothetical protein
MIFEIDPQSTIAMQSFTRNTSAKTSTKRIQQDLRVIATLQPIRSHPHSISSRYDRKSPRLSNRLARALCKTERSHGSRPEAGSWLCGSPEDEAIAIAGDGDRFAGVWWMGRSYGGGWRSVWRMRRSLSYAKSSAKALALRSGWLWFGDRMAGIRYFCWLGLNFTISLLVQSASGIC